MSTKQPSALLYCSHHQAAKKLERLIKKSGFEPKLVKKEGDIQSVFSTLHPSLIILRDTKKKGASLSESGLSFMKERAEIPILWIIDKDDIQNISECQRKTLTIDYLDFRFEDENFLRAIKLLTREKISAGILHTLPEAHEEVATFLKNLPNIITAIKGDIDTGKRESIEPLLHELHGTAQFLGYPQFSNVSLGLKANLFTAGRAELLRSIDKIEEIVASMVLGTPEHCDGDETSTRTHNQDHLSIQIKEMLEILHAQVEEEDWEDGGETFSLLTSLASQSYLPFIAQQIIAIETLMRMNEREALLYSITRTKILTEEAIQSSIPTPVETEIITVEDAELLLREKFDDLLQGIQRALNRFEWDEVTRIAQEASECAEKMGQSELAEQCMIIDIYSGMESFEDTEEQLNMVSEAFKELT